MPDSNIERAIERVCTGFKELGTDAQLARSDQIEQRIGIGGFFKVDSSLGLIKIMDGPIRWIHLKEAREASVEITLSMDYGAPITGEPRLSQVLVYALRRKSFPVFGRVVQLRWKGGRWGQKVADQLNGDQLMLQPTVMMVGWNLPGAQNTFAGPCQQKHGEIRPCSNGTPTSLWLGI